MNQFHELHSLMPDKKLNLPNFIINKDQLFKKKFLYLREFNESFVSIYIKVNWLAIR